MLQYIGARYVPIFYKNSLDPTSSEWEANVSYEPMTWVSLPNGYMYISKKTVPANIGTPAQNGEYWLEAGQYNAYIQSLQNQINTMNDGSVSGSLQNQINNMQDGSIPGSLQDQINDMKDGSVSGSLQDQINDMKDGSVSGSLQDQINGNASNISDIQDVNYYKNKKILILGDSLTDESVLAYQPNWVVTFRNLVETAGGTIDNRAVTSMALSAVIANNLASLLPSLPTSAGYTDIILFLGVNDWLHGATFAQMQTALDGFETWKQTYYPNAIVTFVTPPKALGTINASAPLLYYRRVFLNCGVAKWGWRVIDAYTCAPNYNGNQTTLKSYSTIGDGLHFNTTYAPYFGEFMFNALPSGCYNSAPNFEFIVLSDFLATGYPVRIGYNEDGRITFIWAIQGYTPTANVIVCAGTLPEWARPTYKEFITNYYAWPGGPQAIPKYYGVIEPGGRVLLCVDDYGHALDNITNTGTYNSFIVGQNYYENP